MRRRLTHLLAFAAGLLALTMPAGAEAAGWATGTPLSPLGRTSLQPMVAVTPSGQRIVAWQQTKPGGFPEEGIAVRVAPPNGEFGPVQLFADDRANDPVLKVGSDGTAALAWFDPTGQGNDTAHIARLAPGDSSFAEVTPFSLGATIFDPPSMVVAGGDVFIALGTRDDITTAPNTTTEVSTIQVLRLPAGAGAAVRVGGGAGASLDQESSVFGALPRSIVFGPSIGVAGDTIHVVWEDDRSGSNGPNTSSSILRHATRPVAGGNFTTQTPVATLTVPETSATELLPELAAGAGRAFVVWLTGDKGPLNYQDLSGGQPHAITTNVRPEEVHAVIDAAGEFVLAWDMGTVADDSFGTWAITVAPDGTQAPMDHVSQPNASRVLQDLVAGPDGSTLAITDRVNDDDSPAVDVQVQASIRPAHGTFAPIEEVSGVQDRTNAVFVGSAAGAVGPGGRTLVAWAATDGTDTLNDRMFLSERDTTPPTIASVAVPARAATGADVGMLVAASDALSPISVSWDFGDGSGGSGAAVKHSYGAPGTYTVLVTVRDGAGNVTTQTRRIAVAVAPAPTDTTPPVISAFKLTNNRFRAGNRPTAELAAARRKLAPVGTTIKLHVSERSTVLMAFAGKVAGHTSGKKCLPGPGKGRPCSAVINAGSLIRSGRGPGNVSIPFSGQLGRTRLAPGRYDVAAGAVDAAGNLSNVKIAFFTVVAK